MLTSEEKLARLRALRDLSLGQEAFDDGVTLQEEMEALVIGNWAFLTFDDADNLALSFHIEAHPVAVSKLTRFLVQRGVEFVLYEAFTINDQDEIVFESDLDGLDRPGGL